MVALPLICSMNCLTSVLFSFSVFSFCLMTEKHSASLMSVQHDVARGEETQYRFSNTDTFHSEGKTKLPVRPG